MNKYSSKHGSIMVDAAICFPIFIMAIALLLNLMLLAKQEENLYSEMAQQAATLQKTSALAEYTDPLQQTVYLSRNTKKGTVNLCYRSFSGATAEDDYDGARVFIFPKNEGSEKETPKYHSESCYQLKAHKKDASISVTKTEAENRGYTPCLDCGGE